MVMLGGVEYVTGADVLARWGDVGAARLRDWVRSRRITPLTVAALARLTDRPVPAGVNPDAPARLPSPSGPQNLYAWEQVVEVDLSTRTNGRGARRGRRSPSGASPPDA